MWMVRHVQEAVSLELRPIEPLHDMQRYQAPQDAEMWQIVVDY